MSEEDLRRYIASADFREINEPEYPEVKPMMQQQKLGPCQMHGVFSDAQDWRNYETSKPICDLELHRELVDEAERLRLQADRLLRLAGRL